MTKQQRYFAGALLGAQTYRADLVTSNNLTASSVVLNQSSIITAGVTWMNNQTRPFTPVTIIAAYNQNTTTVRMYSKKIWTLIDVFNGKVNTLAAFQNKLFVGGQFPSMQNQSASLAMYDLASNNSMITVSGALGKVKYINKTHFYSHLTYK